MMVEEITGVYNRKTSDYISKIEIDDKSATIIVNTEMPVNGHIKVMEMKFKGTHKPHTDFVTAMNSLRKHVNLINELTSMKVPRLTITSLTLSGLEADETSHAQITADVTNTTGGIWAIKTPKTTLWDSDKYSNAEELDKRCSNCIKEAFKYIDGKTGEPQMEMDFKTKASGEKDKGDFGIDLPEGVTMSVGKGVTDDHEVGQAQPPEPGIN